MSSLCGACGIRHPHQFSNHLSLLTFMLSRISRSHRRGHDEVAKPALQELCRAQPKIRSPGSASNMSSKPVSDREHCYQRGHSEIFIRTW